MVFIKRVKMILTFKIGTPNFIMHTDSILLLFTDYEYDSKERAIILYRDNILICHYKIDYKDFENEILEAKKDFIRSNINNKKELDKYEKFFGDVLNMIALIEIDRKKREE